MTNKKKKTIGLVDTIEIKGTKGTIKKKALFDTGATRTSVDMEVAAKAGIGPIIKTVKVTAASNPKGSKKRLVALAEIKINGKNMKAEVSIEDRSKLPYPVLIGRDLIHNNFVIDVSKTHTGPRTSHIKKKYK